MCLVYSLLPCGLSLLCLSLFPLKLQTPPPLTYWGALFSGSLLHLQSSSLWVISIGIQTICDFFRLKGGGTLKNPLCISVASLCFSAPLYSTTIWKSWMFSLSPVAHFPFSVTPCHSNCQGHQRSPCCWTQSFVLGFWWWCFLFVCFLMAHCQLLTLFEKVSCPLAAFDSFKALHLTFWAPTSPLAEPSQAPLLVSPYS